MQIFLEKTIDFYLAIVAQCRELKKQHNRKKINKMKIYVIAKRYDNETKSIVTRIVGEFDSVANAAIFKRASTNFYSNLATIVTEDELLNEVK